MKALVYTAPNHCEMQEIPEPQLDPVKYPDGMKIRIDYCAMCATDVHIVTMGLYHMPAPWVMGHECCGTVMEVTEEASKYFKVGDKVVVNGTQPCG